MKWMAGVVLINACVAAAVAWVFRLPGVLLWCGGALIGIVSLSVLAFAANRSISRTTLPAAASAALLERLRAAK